MHVLPKITRVYLIEDDLDDCQLFDDAIKSVSSDIHLECSNDCIDVLQKLEAYAPELIFLDLHLPKKDGLDCLEDIHNTIALRNIPVVMYTGMISPLDIERSLSLGAKLYFEKPSSFSDLVSHLRDVLSLDWHTPEVIMPMVLKGGEYVPMESYLQSNSL
jgi:CheY-like chemotaxis protein